MLADEFAAKEWPGNRGEFLVPRNDPPPPPPGPALVIEPPPWVTNPNFAGAVQPETKPLGNALAELKTRLGDDAWPQWDLGPAAVVEPLRYRIPEPSWREELAAAEARDERDRLANAAKLLGLEQTPKPDYPATKRSLTPTPVPEQPASGSLRVQLPKPPWAEGAA